MVSLNQVFCLLLAGSMMAAAQPAPTAPQPKAAQADSGKAPAAAEDISGMYSFLKEGEFLQINVDREGVTGYVSRMGELESDRGAFLDHFFLKAAVQGHDVSFTTKPVHGMWFEFKGKFDRGPAKTKSQDGYYVLRGTLIEFTTDSDKKATSRSREVEFKFLAQPEEAEPAVRPKK